MRTTKQIWQALIRRFRRSATPQVAVPRREAAPADDNMALRADVAGLQSGLEQLRQRDEQQLGDLQRRIGQLESERDIARKETEVLRNTLADAVSRQEKTETHANTLETRLREQGEKHQATLQETLIRERQQDRRLNLVMAVAIAALVLGLAGSFITYRAAESNTRLLAGINQGIRDMQASIERYQAGTPHEPVAAAAIAKRETSQETTPEQSPVGGDGDPPLQTTADQSQTASTLPEPDFVASASLPLAGHTFKNRRDVHAFFEENARQPGVIVQPSGLQYRVLIPGNGRMPGPSDTVVIEYRAFRPDGTELDNSFRETQPSTFVINEATPGLREALQQMQEGAQWELYIPPALVSKGVRKRGRFGFEPLIYTVELLSVETRQTSAQIQ